MKSTSILCGALTLCAAAALALMFGCDDDSKKVAVTPPITPKFLYASSCADDRSRALDPRPHRKSVVPEGAAPGAIDGFSVDATTGALTALVSGPVSGLDCPEFLTTDPGQKFLFVPDEAANQIHAYTIGSTGALTEVSGSPYAQCAFQIAVDPSGKYLVAPDYCNGNVAVYAIGASGSLTAVTGSPFSETSGNQPETAFIDPSGQWVYIADRSDGPGTISVFAMSAAGALTEISGSPFADADNGYAITGTPDGKYIYVNDFGTVGSEIQGFSVNATSGALTALSTPTYAGGNCWLSADASGTVLFSTDCNGHLYSSLIGSDGSLSTTAGSPFASTANVWPVVGDPSSTFVYAGEDGSPGTISAYTYNSAGVLTAVAGSPFSTGDFIEGIVVTH